MPWAGRRTRLLLLAALVASSQAATVRAADAPSAVSAGAADTCALLSPAGRVACWGGGANGQLGDGTATGSTTPVAVSALVGATAISAGDQHSCAVLRSGVVDCWGYGGRDASVASVLDPSVTPAPVRGLTTAVAVSAGADHTCALLAGGTVECWGMGDSGELGNGRTSNSGTPVAVTGVSSATAVSVSAGHSCAVLAGGTVECWGRGRDGELGNGANADSATPVAVSAISTAIAVSAGENHVCALLANGGIECWGAGDHGQLGDGTSTNSSTPVPVSGVTNAIAVGAGGLHTCAVLATGTVECWGYGGDGELGTPARASSATPVANGIASAIGISSGRSHTCAVLAGGGVQCWGIGDDGELGDGTRRSSATPVNVAGLLLPPPVLGQSTTLQPVSGTVLIKRPGAKDFAALRIADSLPLGTTVDTSNGRVRLTSAADAAGRTQAGLFYGGIFRTGQQSTGARAGLTVLTLAGPLPTGCAAAAAATVSKKRKRLVWGDAKGNFTTRGRYGSATVRGTKWLVEDSCTGTQVRVARGSVRFEDVLHHKTIVVTANHSFTVGPGSSGKTTQRGETTRSFAVGIERLLSRLAHGRAQLAAALDGATSCALSPKVAATRVASVIDNRSTIRSGLDTLGAPTAKGRTVVARLKSAVDHSLAADRHYREWLAGLDGAHATCPLPRTGPFAAAGREDTQATKAKRRFLAAFNPIARREHLRAWRPDQI